MNYDHRAIEGKWQEFWARNQTFASPCDRVKPKFYILDMFPYPSGSGLHVGHTLGYTGSDIIARYKRMCGYNVLHPMGWDSFGLPAEQFAVRTGRHPAETTAENIARYRQQLKGMGYSYDWSREFATSDPRYYKWTQWMFGLLYRRGLAYEAEIPVNYCPELSAVLANEEVEDGRSKEGGYAVFRRPLRQWLLRITEYAERLLADLDSLDWPEALKIQQRHWIGKSAGAEVAFDVVGQSEGLLTFTTRPDTLLGVTFLAIAPEHPLADRASANNAAIAKYRQMTSQRSDLQRSEGKEKSGIFSGFFAEHPVTGESIPIWVADYVLATYGTGAVMGVPAHDERDFAFAEVHGLAIRAVIRQKGEGGAPLLPFAERGVICNTDTSELRGIDGLESQTGGEAIALWLAERGKGGSKVTYKLRDWLFSRQRYWGEPIPILHLADGTKRPLALDELPLLPPQVENFKPGDQGESPLVKAQNWVQTFDDRTGQRAHREINTMPQWAGSCWYYLRFCSPDADSAFVDPEEERYWMPVDAYVGGAEHAVLHLLYARFWHKVLYDSGLVSTSEPFARLNNPGMVTARSYRLPTGGYVEANSVMTEPSSRAIHQPSGMELIVQMEKMSKSKLNGVNPDELLERFGADALRIYQMFMGPFDREKIWNTDAVIGSYRFLQRVYQLVSRAVEPSPDERETSEALIITQRLLSAAVEDFEAWSFNTLIAKMMEYLNEIASVARYPKACAEIFVSVLAPVAPHLAEELWEKLGHLESIALAPFPQVDQSLLARARPQVVTYVIQVNGKVRAKLEGDRGLTRDEVLKRALSHSTVAKFTAGKALERIAFVPDKLLNIAVAP